jgi:hypothetical protein
MPMSDVDVQTFPAEGGLFGHLVTEKGVAVDQQINNRLGNAQLPTNQ